MENVDLDALILSLCEERPQKVAMIIAKVAELTTETDLAAIGDRIPALANAGELVSFGDVTDWRHSEIALSPPH